MDTSGTSRHSALAEILAGLSKKVWLAEMPWSNKAPGLKRIFGVASLKLWSLKRLVSKLVKTGISYKCFLSQLLTSIINKIGYQVESGISLTNRFNLQFLVIVLLLITLFLGISWIFILVKDNADVDIILPSSSRG